MVQRRISIWLYKQNLVVNLVLVLVFPGFDENKENIEYQQTFFYHTSHFQYHAFGLQQHNMEFIKKDLRIDGSRL